MGEPGPRLSDERGDARRAVNLAVRAELQRLVTPGQPEPAVLVALSGGADSLALLAATVEVADPLHVRVHVVAVDHGWHPRTATVARACAATALSLGVERVGVVRVVPGRGGGAEDAARSARLAALEGAARRWGAAAVLLGHTLDDQAEQVLLGLARGSGARSVRGMPARRGVLRRPLLGLRREVVALACPQLRTAGVDLPWSDPSNSDPAHLRSRVRAELLPRLQDVLGPGSVEALARTADLLRADCDALDGWAERELADSGGDPDVERLAGLPPAVRSRVLRELAARAGAGALTAAHLRGMDDLVTAWRGQRGVDLPGGLRVRRHRGADGCGRLRFARGPGPRGRSA